MISPEESIPIFTASGRISVKILSICCPANSGVTSMIPCTPVVFCAVNAMTALIPYTPLAAIVLRSAWIPAPPLQSLPAMVSTFFISNAFKKRRTISGLSFAANNPLTTATPSMPVPVSSFIFSAVIPPMATTGISTASQIAHSSSFARVVTSDLV